MKNQIDGQKTYWASFNTFELRIPGQAVIDCTHSGDCDLDVKSWCPAILELVKMDDFTNKPTEGKIRKELKEYGAWSEKELDCPGLNWERICWIACGNIAEDETPDCSAPLPN